MTTAGQTPGSQNLALTLYRAATRFSGPLLELLLNYRRAHGREDPSRVAERKGVPSRPRPDGRLVWIHAASVGEAQSSLILIESLRRRAPDARILVTTGTRTAAELMERRLPAPAFHQFYPLDHPAWVSRFLDHWKPNLALWMESEVWPNMLLEIKSRNFPAVLVNARLSPSSARRWQWVGSAIKNLLEIFCLCLAQSEKDAERLRLLGARNVIAVENLKYGAAPLPVEEDSFDRLRQAVGDRPLWLFASTHAGEEAMACRIHRTLRVSFPEILTLVVPRHPSRRDEILGLAKAEGLKARLRGESRVLPQAEDDLYIADTLGELGLFYRLAPVACIGRSFSEDGGGGHNPIEAAQHGCGVLYGPNVQNMGNIYSAMAEAQAARGLADEKDLENTLRFLLSHPQELSALRDRGRDFVTAKADVADRVMTLLDPILTRSGFRVASVDPYPGVRQARHGF